jgi:hypothetical protein
MSRPVQLKGFRLGKDGKPKRVPRDASAACRQRAGGSKKVRVKRKGA